MTGEKALPSNTAEDRRDGYPLLLCHAEFAKIWRESRLRRRFMPERAVVAEALAQGHTPDATVDEVGAAGDNVGFDGHPIRSKTANGYGTGGSSRARMGRLGRVAAALPHPRRQRLAKTRRLS